MKPYAKWVAASLLATSSIAVAQTTPQDVPPGHWAYEAVQELAGKGLVLGYPDGKFLGNRALTRYEMAALTQRLLRRLEELIEQKTANAAPAAGVSPEDLAEVRRLVDEYKVELTVMGTDLRQVKTQLGDLQGTVADLNNVVGSLGEKVGGIEQDVSTLKKGVQISGYVQSRYESGDGIYAPGAKPDGRFFIRRGRLKFTHTGEKADYVFQFGGEGQNAFGLKDAYAAWKLNTPPKGVQGTQVWFGQFNTPFGYEVERSDVASEFPERSIAEGFLFNGERDRGIRLVHGFGPRLWGDVSVLNGGGINEPFADDKFKDFTARLKGTLAPWWKLGVSGYWGKKQGTTGSVAAKPATPAASAFLGDLNGNGLIDANEVTVTPGTPAVAAIPGNKFEADRKRFGFDSQMNVLGGTLWGEVYWARQPVNNPAANPLPAFTDTKALGYYAAYAYNLNPANILALRYDFWDPDRDRNGKGDAQARWNAAFNHYLSRDFKLSASYEWFPTHPTATDATGRYTLQAQKSF